jgi:hypothetical protein
MRAALQHLALLAGAASATAGMAVATGPAGGLIGGGVLGMAYGLLVIDDGRGPGGEPPA